MKKPLFKFRMKLVHKETGEYEFVDKINMRDSTYTLHNKWLKTFTEMDFEKAHSTYTIFNFNNLYDNL